MNQNLFALLAMKLFDLHLRQVAGWICGIHKLVKVLLSVI